MTVGQSISFDRAAQYYDDTRGFLPGVDQDAAKTIARAGQLTTASRVLEFGVRTGRIALPLANYVASVHGLDLARPMMLRLRAKQTDEAIYLAKGDATRLPYADHGFDAVVGVHIFHLIPDWKAVLVELVRVLKPNAPFVQCWSKNVDVFKSLWSAWRSAVPDNEASDVGLSWDKNDDSLRTMGWRVGEAYTFDYTYARSPADFIQPLENRVWSRTWRLSDVYLAASVAAVKAVVAKEFPNPTVGLTVYEQFVAKPYYPPQ